MNFLAHLFLTPQNPQSHIGSLLADFTRIGNNNLRKYFTPDISNAVILHRMIDSFTDSHSDTNNAVHLFFNKYRHYSRIVIDIIFDHFLTKNWTTYTDTPFQIFASTVYQSFSSLPHGLPDNFYLFTQRLLKYEILSAYGSIDDLKEVLNRTELRIKSRPGIDMAWIDLLSHYNELGKLFESFFPQIIKYLNENDSILSLEISNNYIFKNK